MNTRSGRPTFIKKTDTIGQQEKFNDLMGNLMSNLKTKQSDKNTWIIQFRKFTTSKDLNVAF